ncbi:hypothetical protein ACS0TY_001518 [Phlomoides rotata]
MASKMSGMEFDTAHFITDVFGKYPQLWALKGAHPVTVNRWYKFGVLASIRTVAPSFREISELPDWTNQVKTRRAPLQEKMAIIHEVLGHMRKKMPNQL